MLTLTPQSSDPKYTHEFIIDRKIWSRGMLDGGETYLYNPKTGSKCCVGIFLSSLGVEDTVLSYRGTLENTVPSLDIIALHKLVIEKFGGPDNVNQVLGHINLLYNSNDSLIIDDSERERQVKDLFGSFEVKVSFVN